MAEIDPKQLELGTQIATKSGTKLSIIRFLGEGGQGSVYEVDYGCLLYTSDAADEL